LESVAKLWNYHDSFEGEAMPDLNNFKICFLHRGHINFVYVVTKNLHEADIWKHIADRLGLFYCNSEGHTMLSHAVKKMVEANGVTEVLVEKLEIFDIPIQTGEKNIARRL
jgi:hypothetical protein